MENFDEVSTSALEQLNHFASTNMMRTSLVPYWYNFVHTGIPSTDGKPSEAWNLAAAAAVQLLRERQQVGGPDRKPEHSYIALIAMAILSSEQRKLLLCDIYRYISDRYSYFRNPARGAGWRNSIRHNLSLNECFVKAGRSANGKGHYWAIHPANLSDFMKGDFRRRNAQRKVRSHVYTRATLDASVTEIIPLPRMPIPTLPMPTTLPPPIRDKKSTKRNFDMASLLMPDNEPEESVSGRLSENEEPDVADCRRMCSYDVPAMQLRIYQQTGDINSSPASSPWPD